MGYWENFNFRNSLGAFELGFNCILKSAANNASYEPDDIGAKLIQVEFSRQTKRLAILDK